MLFSKEDVAFTLESIAHLSTNLAIKKHAGHLLLASIIVRNSTDEQLKEASEALLFGKRDAEA